MDTLPNLPWKEYDRVICIPTYNEFEYLPQVLEDACSLSPSTIVVIHNNCRVDSPLEVQQNNQRLHDWLLSFPHSSEAHHHLIQFHNIDIWLLDYTHPARRFPTHEGVGLARHQLGEFACALINKGIVTTPWMWCTDGDVRLPDNYLDVPTIPKGVELLGYVHQPAPLELSLYEIGLRYYTLGLRWADSTIAFPTIGSCIVIHADTFQKIYGFPKRQAAEDFYLLNKAVKVDPVHYASHKTLTIRGRPSDRVPFGTGQGMRAIAEDNLQYNLYHPTIFSILKQWNAVLKTEPDETLINKLQTIVPDYPYFKKLGKVLRQPCPKKQRIRRRFVFFDCFQTMRWVHHLRDTQYPSIPIAEALFKAPFINIKTSIPSPSSDTLEQWQNIQQQVYQQESTCRGKTFQL